MKKKLFLLIAVLTFTGLVAGLAGYYAAAFKFQKNDAKERFLSAVPQKTAQNDSGNEDPYYVVKMEGESLFIYEMPANVMYDSVSRQSLNLSDGQLSEIDRGLVFKTLPDVFEFLENSMS